MPVYVPASYGRGLMPDTFIDFKKQRFRWAYGAMQILKAHARALFIEGGPLSAGQRYHFIAGWLPWVADGCNLLFNLAALGWSVAMVWAPHEVDAPLVMYSVLPLSLFTFKLAKLCTCTTCASAPTCARPRGRDRRTRAHPHHRQGVGEGPGHPQRAVLPHPQARRHLGAAAGARGGARGDPDDVRADAVGLGGGALLAHRGPGSLRRGPDRLAWIVVLLVQAVPYASSLIVSLISAFPLSGAAARHQLPAFAGPRQARPRPTRRTEPCARRGCARSPT